MITRISSPAIGSVGMKLGLSLTLVLLEMASGGDPARAQLRVEEQLALDAGAPAVVEAAPAAPTDAQGLRVWEEASRASGRHILVSLEQRRLWLMDGSTVLYAAPVAVGKSVVMEYEDEVWNFATPRGRREVLSKQKNPVWVPPDWHYVELAMAQGWELVPVTRDDAIELSDGSRVVVRGQRMGRLTPSGAFVPIPAGEEAVFEGKLFMPPLDTTNRRIPGELGLYKLDLGDAYYLHGTPYPESIGGANTHGCIRLLESDLAHLFEVVRVGTPVFLY